MDNPTGAENAQVQERTPIEELGRGLTALYLEVHPSIADDIRARADAALREAKQRGMRRAAEIALQHAPNPVDSTDRVVVFVLAAVVQAIERAATQED